jgi:hypothetical protein
MNRDNLPGLSPLWIISLAMILGVVILTFIPISIATGENIKSSDWIGFAGSIAAGFMTLVAAVVAWFAVQKQISIQQEIARTQTAIQKFSILQSEFTALETERILILNLKAQARMADNLQALLRNGQPLNIFQARLLMSQYLSSEKAIEKFDANMEIANHNRWIFPESKANKMAVFERKMEFTIALGKARIDLEFISKEYSTEDEHSVLKAHEQTVCAAIDLKPTATAMIAACDEFVSGIRPALDRVESIINQARLDAGV